MTTKSRPILESPKIPQPANARGIPVAEGMTFADLTYAQRLAYFRQHENHWKQKINSNPNQTQKFTRGDE